MNRGKDIPKTTRVALVSNTSWSIYNFRLGLIRRLKEMGYEVMIIAPKDSWSAKLIAEGFSFHNLYLDNYGSNPMNELRSIRQLARIYRKYDIDFIFHYTIKPNIYGSLMARWNGIPSVAITTGLGHLFSYSNSIVKSLANRLYRFALRYSEQVWFLNELDRDTFLEKKIVSKNQTYILPSEGINIDRFRPEEVSSPTPLNFLYAGRIIWDKGIKEFSEAARAIREVYPDATFQLLGFIDPANPNSVSVEQIEQWQKNDILQYLGETEDVRPYIANCCCLVFPSFYREGISRILLEAAAMGKPIITTDNVGCREVVDNGYNGYLCKVRDSKDLINKIHTFLLLSPEERQQMGRNGRKKIIREFDEEIVVKKYIQLLAQYLGKNKVARTKGSNVPK